MANTVNAALKPLETLSRIVNQPSSLFGSKSASSKSKSEQDAQGAAQDSNSNQQDPGRESEPMDWRAGWVVIVILWAWHHSCSGLVLFPWELAGVPQMCHSSVGICPTKNSLKLQPCFAILTRSLVFSFVTHSFFLWQLINLPREGTLLFSCFPHGALHIGTLLIILLVGWLFQASLGKQKCRRTIMMSLRQRWQMGISWMGRLKPTQWWLLGSLRCSVHKRCR